MRKFVVESQNGFPNFRPNAALNFDKTAAFSMQVPTNA
jgi:hypothetical protein